MPEKTRKDRHISSINVGFRLIQALIDSPRPMPLKDLCDVSGFQSGHAFLYLTSFLQVGLVSQDAGTSRYDLGPLAFDLGLAAMRRADVVALARDPMYELAAQTHQSVFLSVWGNRGPTLVSKVDAPQLTALQLSLGFVLSVLETASGRLFLAHLPRGQTQALLAAELAAGPQIWKTKFSPALVERLLAATIKNGVSLSDPNRNDGYASIAAPIFDHASALRAAVTLTGPNGAFEKNSTMFQRAVTQAGMLISEKLGFRSNQYGKKVGK
jgi:DNA-binding IclR family transcriptional regulator